LCPSSFCTLRGFLGEYRRCVAFRASWRNLHCGPEMIILRKVLSVKLIAVFVAVVASGILAVGFLFNLLFS